MMKTILMDIDHTVSDSFWRDHLIPAAMAGTPGDWDEYHAGLMDDRPLHDIVEMIRILSVNYQIVAVTARPEKWRKATVDWMLKHDIPIDDLLMRPEGDYRRAIELKPALVREYFRSNNINDWTTEVAFVMDDRDDIVAAFKALGVTAIQIHARKGKPQ